MRRTDVRRSPLALRLAGAVLAPVLLAGCLAGEGPVTHESREVRPFRRIEIGSGIHFVVRIGPATPLDVAAQANILTAIATEVAGDTLHVEATDDFSTSEPVTVTVTTPDLAGIDLSGGAQARIDAFDGATLDVSVKGGGSLTASGTVGEITLTVDGGSDADLADLAATRIDVTMGGGASATVFAHDQVKGSASAGALLSVLGGPSIDVVASGGAEVTTR